MYERYRKYLPDSIKSYNPVVVEAINNREPLILVIAREIMAETGVIQLPPGWRSQPELSLAGDTTIQAFSSFGAFNFTTILHLLGKSDEPTEKLLGGQANRILDIKVEMEGKKERFIPLLNTHKSALYEYLTKRSSGLAVPELENTWLGKLNPTDIAKIKANFEQKEFARFQLPEVTRLINDYLSSLPRPDLADEHYRHLTKPGNRLAGEGDVFKLYR